MHRYLGWLVLLGIIGGHANAAPLDARAVCGTPSEEISQETKGTLEGKAQTLARLGTAELQGAASIVKKEIEVRESRSDAARELHYLNYISCVLIYQDTHLTTDEKLRRIDVLRGALKPISSPGGLRERLRSSSVRMIGNSLSKGQMWPAANFTIENLTGIGLGIALRKGGTSVGPCNNSGPVSGLTALWDNEVEQLQKEPNPVERLRWFPAGSKVSATITMQCQFPVFGQFKTVPITVNAVLAAGRDVVVLPISADIPIRAAEPNNPCPPGHYQQGAFCFPTGGAFRFQ